MGWEGGETVDSRVSEQTFPARMHSAWTWATRCHHAEPSPIACGTWAIVIMPCPQNPRINPAPISVHIYRQVFTHL